MTLLTHFLEYTALLRLLVPEGSSSFQSRGYPSWMLRFHCISKFGGEFMKSASRRETYDPVKIPGGAMLMIVINGIMAISFSC